MVKYKRILLKISGESLAGKSGSGIDTEMLNYFSTEIKSAVDCGVEIAVVIGGGNIFRGLQGAKNGFDRVQGDYMGMLATTINSMALQGMLESLGVKSVVLGGLAIDPVCEKMSSRRAMDYLKQGNVVIIAGGSGNPFFTTDSAGALRAIEIHADILLKGTRVDGVYDKNPETCPDAVKFDEITFDEAYERNLHIMDLTAFTLCKENNMPIIVFNMNTQGNLYKVVNGEKVGTKILNE
ncbi:MAG: UMP kinase [Bacteroidales bacterium]|jgi:uridylate kinase|nr:UMP kinase [Bacteroidales bacterium]MBO7345959.1 UMP kinase [Bacteroidales bacterium]MBQ4478557.1 UMP kinase [Bacteroidales bacterium]MBR4453966.1 UMP kinase [Bacteroidales bacterium]